MVAHADALLSGYLTLDVEEAQVLASGQPPSLQKSLLRRSLTRLVGGEDPPATATKLLGIIRVLLSGTYPSLNENEALQWIGKLVSIATAQADSELRAQMLTVLALMANRIRDGLADSPEATQNGLGRLLDLAESPREARVTAALNSRLLATRARVEARRRRTGRSFDVPQLDLQLAAANVNTDIEGDWYQDPWGWPEINWLVRQQPQRVVNRLKDAIAGWTVPIDVAKQGGGSRPAIVLSPLDRLAYQALVDEMSLDVIGPLPEWVFGWRLPRRQAAKGKYLDNNTEWKQFRKKVVTDCRRLPFTAHLDIQSFFSSVDTGALLSQMGRRYRNSAVLDRLEVYFQAWSQCPNGAGIPQRSLSSSVLAHAVLRPLDTYLEALSNADNARTFAAARWMDDIWLFSDNEQRLRNQITEVEGILGQVRLSLNAEKTKLFESTKAGEVVQLLEASSGPGERLLDEAALTPERLLNRAEDAPRFTVSLAVKKMLRSGDFSPIAKLAPGGLARYTHAADHLAEALRKSGLWERHADWYLTFARQRVSQETWSVAAWAEMFPNNPSGGIEKVHSFFTDNITRDLQRLLTPLAAQRLAAWQPRFNSSGLGEALVEEARTQDDSFKFRAVCLAVLTGGANTESVRRAASDATDEVTADYLRDTNFSPPALSRRFRSE